ncbi:ModD protein [Methylibium sp.]|uniref:ModD protein n=1 Tax=Methylibium sp. TaxID=2067992 RepID=UPI003D117241
MERLSDDVLHGWLREDAPHGDLSTRALGIGTAPAQLQFRARQALRVALVEEAARLFELCGGSAEVHRPSGADAQAGDLLLSAAGAAAGLLLAWKVAQTGMEVASGIAGETARILGLLRAAGHPQPLACTRKTPPGGRALAVRAVLAGGGVMHRLGLSESLLVFPEHRLFLSPEVLPARLAGLRVAQPEKRLVVEVGDEAEALALAAAGAEVLQLERFTPDALRRLKRALQARGLQPLLAPAGGVTAANAVAYAEAGADFLVSSAPYHAPPADVQVRFTPG